MFAITSSRRLVVFSQKVLLVMLALVVMLCSFSVKNAKAWTIQGTGGNGNIISVPQMDLGDITQPYGRYFNVWGAGLVVQRSPLSNRSQTITAIYYLEQYVGANKWQGIQSQVYTGQLVVGGFHTYTFPAVKFSLPVESTGYFRVRFGIFVSETNGRILSAVTVSPYHESDFICSYALRPCQSFSGFFRIGQYNTNTW